MPPESFSPDLAGQSRVAHALHSETKLGLVSRSILWDLNVSQDPSRGVAKKRDPT
jgi:hypothetical protein